MSYVLVFAFCAGAKTLFPALKAACKLLLFAEREMRLAKRLLVAAAGAAGTAGALAATIRPGKGTHIHATDNSGAAHAL